MDHLTIITNEENVGTAKAVNQGLKERRADEYCIKMDNDVIVNHINWVEEMEEAMRRDASIGILALKRKDLAERPDATNPHFKTRLRYLPPTGVRWLIFEEVQAGVMGTCTMFSPALLDKIGYLYQPTVYGWDDGLISTRSTLAGFVNGFLPHIDIDHIDPGDTFYQKWKEQHATETVDMVSKIDMEYRTGKRPIYEEA